MCRRRSFRNRGGVAATRSGGSLAPACRGRGGTPGRRHRVHGSSGTGEPGGAERQEGGFLDLRVLRGDGLVSRPGGASLANAPAIGVRGSRLTIDARAGRGPVGADRSCEAGGAGSAFVPSRPPRNAIARSGCRGPGRSSTLFTACSRGDRWNPRVGERSRLLPIPGRSRKLALDRRPRTTTV